MRINKNPYEQKLARHKGKIIKTIYNNIFNYILSEYCFSKSEYDFNFSFKMAP